MIGDHDKRPWGSYTVLDDQESHKVKRIVVSAGKRLSYQRHSRRAEHWFILAGEALVTLDGRRHQLVSGAAIDIPVESAHRIENTGEGDLVFIVSNTASTSVKTTS